MDDNRILFVDLDGTLIKEDLSNLAFIYYLKKNPLKLLVNLFIFLIKGKPFLKEKISKNFIVPFNKLTFNKSALEYVRNVKKHHRVVYLISGSHQILVSQVNEHLKIFFESFGTKDNFNLVGYNKVIFIKENLRIREFDYFGNSKKDLPIWDYSKKIIYTNASSSLKKIIHSRTIEKFEIKENFSN
tara:strand:+ start:1627 stop:2184 length:558 start_codon:yes stop_codon:yes gene_type:complete